MLVPGGYDLLKRNDDGETKTVFFVKGTDSLHRAFNEYLKNKGSNKPDLSIEFDEENGTIYIPTIDDGSSSDSAKRVAQFKFNVDSNVAMQGQQGRFECVQHTIKNERKLMKFGALTKRLRIHASEDVYEKTKNRIAAIELKQRNNCTQEIDLNLHSVNCKVSGSRKSQTVGKITRGNSRQLTKTCNPSLMRRSLRERIIHMLAVRPYRKIELSAALRKDGIKESEKNHVMYTLTSVATQKDNVYRLLRHVWNDIDENWPFYSGTERQLMKRNKPQNLTPPQSDSGISVSSNQSPNSNPIGDTSPSCQYKRPGYYAGVDGFQTKRQRISHYTKKTNLSDAGSSVNTFASLCENEENIDQITASRISACFDEIIEKKSGLSVKAVESTPVRTSPRRSLKTVTSNSSNSAAETRKKRSIGARNKNVGPAKQKVNVTKSDADSTTDADRRLGVNYEKRSAEPNDTITDVSRSPLPTMTDLRLSDDCTVSNANDSISWDEFQRDYKQRYRTITSLEQRTNYKSDFMKFYEEYHKLMNEVLPVTRVFKQLAEELKNHEKGTEEYLMIEAEIKKRYDLANAVKFKETKRKFDQLHDMLAHIKNLVEEFDEKFY